MDIIFFSSVFFSVEIIYVLLKTQDCILYMYSDPIDLSSSAQPLPPLQFPALHPLTLEMRSLHQGRVTVAFNLISLDLGVFKPNPSDIPPGISFYMHIMCVRMNKFCVSHISLHPLTSIMHYPNHIPPHTP